MKRGLVLSLCAAALAISSTAAQAQTPTVSLALNLRYNDPADTTEGGTWYLVGKTASANGIGGVSAYFNNINTAGVVYGNGGTAGNGYVSTTQADINGNVATGGGTPFNGTFGTAVNVVYGQDNSATAPNALKLGVGTAGFAKANANDVFANNATWGGATLLMRGTFGATRPTVATNVGPQSNNTDANILAGATLGVAAIDANTTIVIRGDSVTPDGLKRGDADRNGTVNSDDFDKLALNFGTGTTWDQGDFNDSGTVNSDDFDSLALAFGTSRTPPAVGASFAAVPEPASVALAALSLCGLYFVRRKA